jgi:hypothetical protein
MARERGATGRIQLLVRILTIALFIGGLSGGLSNFNGVVFWPWNMPLLAHRFLASASAAYVIGSLLTLRSRRWLESELLIATVVLYGVPLGLSVALQAEKINWATVTAWGFVLLVTPSLIISLFYLWLNREVAASEATEPLGRPLRTYLLALAGLAGFVGLVVYLVPKSAGFVWPWASLATWAELDSRLAASMLITISGAALLSYWRNDRKQTLLFLAMFSAYCLVASLALVLHATITPAFVLQDLIYVAIFAVLAALGWVLASRRFEAGLVK